MSVIYVKYTLNKNNLYNGPTCLDSSYFFLTVQQCCIVIHYLIGKVVRMMINPKRITT